MAVNVDDSAHPADNDAVVDPASAGAAELRALKSKLNNIFLSTGVDHDADHLITLNGRGLYVVYTAANVGSNDATKILYGFASNVTRSGGTEHTVGAQFSAIQAPGLNPGGAGTFGVVASSVSDPTSVGSLTASEFDAVSQNSNNAQLILGCNIVFKNRFDGQAAPISGIGSNKYNFNSIALWFTSQPRGTSGEYCGWNKGIVFDEFSMDLANGIRNAVIDTFALHYDGGTDPRSAYRVDTVLRMRTLQSLSWEDGGSGKTRIFVDPSDGKLKITQETLPSAPQERWAVNLTTGQVYKNGVLQY